jgi:hypothetical protein
MNAYVFDLEGDGLNPSKIHCLCYSKSRGGPVNVLTDYQDMREFIRSSDILIGHNIQRFDIPVLERILGVEVKSKLRDTLALSWYLFPTEVRHGLAQWGERLGVSKPVVEDWENLPLEVYIDRCSEDVKINVSLWNLMRRRLSSLYGSTSEIEKLLDYVEFKMDCAKEQERSGWHLDVDKAIRLRDELTKIIDERTSELSQTMPKVPVYAVRKKPKAMFKINGQYSAKGEAWVELLKEQDLPKDTVEAKVLVRYDEPNPASHDQIKSWLFSMGWRPKSFKLVRDKDTREVREIPQVRVDVGGEKVLCPSITKLMEKEPSLRALDGLTVAAHRLSIVQAWLDTVKDGKIQAEIQGFTNTLRFKHKTVVNVPGVFRPFGEDIRSCLIAPKGYILCGSDMSSLEDRTKQHYMYPYDPEYVDEMNKPDFDPHLDLALFNNALSKEQVRAYKDGSDMSTKPIRTDYKSANYACTYGAQPARLQRELGISFEKAKKLFDGYWARNWSIENIAKDAVVKNVDGLLWLWNPVAQLWYYLKHDKDKFSTLNQGTATYCFDTWLKFVREKRPQLTAQFHDEIVLLIKEGYEAQCSGLLKDCIDKTNRLLKLNRSLDIGIDYGRNYAEIH